MPSKNIDKISNLQVCLEACGPISWYRSIELDKLNNFCSICLYKIITRKKSLPSTNFDKISIRQASHEARRPISRYRSIHLNKLNKFCSICFYNIFTRKKVIAIEKYRQKINSTGEPWGPRAYFWVSFHRARLPEQLLFYMSLKNIDELNVIQRVSNTRVQVSY